MNKDRYNVSRAAAAAGLLACMVYLPALQNGFVNWDDEEYVVENSLLRAPLDILLTRSFGELQLSNWHPLTLLSHAIDYRMWGLEPAGHHLTSMLFHGLNTFLITVIVLMLVTTAQKHFPSERPASPLRPLTAAFFTGLLFGLHPIHVESVAWVSERKDVLFTFFYLLSVLCYLMHADRDRLGLSGRSRASGVVRSLPYTASLLFFLLSLMSKPMAVTLPAVLLLLDWYPLNRPAGRPWTALAWEKAPFFTLSIGSIFVTLFAQGSAIISLTAIPFPDRVVTGISSLAAYLGKIIIPLNLSPYYPYPMHVSLLSWKYAFLTILAIGMTVCAFALRNKKPAWSALWFFYCISLLPVLGFIQVGNQVMADRYAYLPSVAPLLLIGIASALLYGRIAHTSPGGRARVVLFAIGAVLLIASLSAATVRQIAVWKNSVSLWSRAIELIADEDLSSFRTAGLAFTNRGSAYEKAGMMHLAMSDYQRALSLKPDDAMAHGHIGYMLLRQGQPGQAIPKFLISLQFREDLPEPHLGLGQAYYQMKRYDDAAREFDRAAEIAPSDARPHFYRGSVYAEQGKAHDAITSWEKAVRLKPDWPEAHYALGNAYFSEGRIDESLQAYQTALRYRPRYAEALINLGSTYLQQGSLQEAAVTFEAAVASKPDSAEAHYNLSIAYDAIGRRADAEKELGLSRAIISRNSGSAARSPSFRK